jgi:hypothetical protein
MNCDRECGLGIERNRVAKCSKCGETTNPTKDRFCSKCGNKVKAEGANLGFTPVKTLNKFQNECLKNFVDELQFLITKYEIQGEPLSRDEAKEYSNDKAYSIWRTSPDWASGSLVSGDNQTNYVGGFWLGQGDCEDCDDFYLSHTELEDEVYEGAYTELRFVCHSCESDADLLEDCTNCDGEGEFIFDLSWESGKVHYDSY